MTTTAEAGSARRNAERNFILQQGLPEPAATTCSTQYAALLFQPRLVAVWVVVATAAQSPRLFAGLGAVLWWSASVPRLNPFDALYNRTLARASGTTLGPAPAPRRFAQLLAGSCALAIGASLAAGAQAIALALEAFFVAAVGALVFGGLCLGSFLFHRLGGRGDFATRTMPWSRGA
jgi:uncharacterized protein DUF4395